MKPSPRRRWISQSKRSSSSPASRKNSSSTPCTPSAPMRSARAVEPTRSQKSTVTCLRSPSRWGAMGAAGEGARRRRRSGRRARVRRCTLGRGRRGRSRTGCSRPHRPGCLPSSGCTAPRPPQAADRARRPYRPDLPRVSSALSPAWTALRPEGSVIGTTAERAMRCPGCESDNAEGRGSAPGAAGGWRRRPVRPAVPRPSRRSASAGRAARRWPASRPPPPPRPARLRARGPASR